MPLTNFWLESYDISRISVIKKRQLLTSKLQNLRTSDKRQIGPCCLGYDTWSLDYRPASFDVKWREGRLLTPAERTFQLALLLGGTNELNFSGYIGGTVSRSPLLPLYTD